jgi:hypothetical protein
MRRVITLSIFLVVVVTGSLLAKGAGTSGAIILHQPIGARACGMGEAYTAVGGEVGVVHYNPAGLVSLSRREVSFTYQRGLADDNFMSLVYGQPTRIGVFGGLFSYYTAGEMELIDLEGDETTVKAEQDFVVLAGFGKRVMERLPLGINVKVISSRIAEAETGTSFAVDFGALYEGVAKGLTLGLAIRNLGTELKFIDEGDPLPLMVSTGVSYERSFGRQKILVSADFPFLVYEQIVTPGVGIEFDWREMLQGRIGYKFNSDDAGLTVGMGFQYRNYLLNYGFGLANRLENSHRVSLGVKF